MGAEDNAKDGRGWEEECTWDAHPAKIGGWWYLGVIVRPVLYKGLAQRWRHTRGAHTACPFTRYPVHKAGPSPWASQAWAGTVG